MEVVLAARCRRTYSNAHTYHINSVSMSSDQETFISVDDLRINLWHLDCNNQSFNIVDMKPPNMDDLTEVRPVATARRMRGFLDRVCPGQCTDVA